MGILAACTIVAKQHLPVARVLADSFLEHNPGSPFYVLLTDEVEGCFQPEAERFRLLQLHDLAIPAPTSFRFHYSQPELSYAATPFLIEHLLDQGFRDIAFLKQESLVLGELASIFDGGRHSLMLTPHLLRPLPGPDRIARELNILQAGSFNAGFVGVSEGHAARAFLKWWQERTFRHCQLDVTAGMHYEQRWLDLAPSYFAGVHILRDPGINVAHWNLPERQISITPQGDVMAEGRPCRFFRFSGFDFEQPYYATRYNTRLHLDNLGPAAAVYRRYHEGLVKAGCHETKAWPYAYGSFDNGVPIPYAARRLYRELGDRAGRFGDPFLATGRSNFLTWVNGPGEGSDLKPHERLPGWESLTKLFGKGRRSQRGGKGQDGSAEGETPAITRLWMAVYDHRPDLQAVYPDVLGEDRQEFLQWIVAFGYQDCEIDERFPIISEIPVVR